MFMRESNACSIIRIAASVVASHHFIVVPIVIFATAIDPFMSLYQLLLAAPADRESAPPAF